ncbi:MAG: DNA replication/repair protein RecF [Alphaproteobacteria bacterium]|nr:DNA replication/repair protein RecF [Alphaproteobacteria bacterium]
MYMRSREDFPGAAQRDSRREEENSAVGVFVCRLQTARFRNYPFLRLDLPANCPQIVLTGKNGVGKTNLIEAVSFLVPGRGLRQAKFADILPKGNDQATAWGITATLHRGDEEIEVGTDYEKIDGKNSEKRRVRINGASGLAQAELGRICSAVWLTPAMDRLFSAEPGGRRRFLDRLVQAFFENHASACAAYHQALRQWGALIREGQNDQRWLSALETTLGKYGAEVAWARRQTTAILQTALEKEDNISAFPRPLLSLQGGWEEELASVTKEEARDLICSRFSQAREAYARNGSAGGIHTVDLAALHREKNMPAAACSTGEQKALLISVLLAHIKAQALTKGVFPLVLFDEAAAHLDDNRRNALMNEIAALKTQVWLTGTDPRSFENLKETAHFVAVDELLRTAPDWAAAS